MPLRQRCAAVLDRFYGGVLMGSALMFCCLFSEGQCGEGEWRFLDVTREAGFEYVHGFVDGYSEGQARMICGGVAAGDYDRDGWVDLYVVRGDVGPNLLFRNRGDGTFEELGEAAGVSGTPALGCGPVFADLDGDGWLDLFVGGIEGAGPVTFRNRGDGTFENVSATSGIRHEQPQFSAAAGDFDRDGWLDIVTAHWVSDPGVRLWRNEGNAVFTEVTAGAGLLVSPTHAFSPTFADIDSDGWPDLLIAGDFGTSMVFHNKGDGTFSRSVDPAISDENGMGAAVADYDNDGDLDWFVSSIWDPDGDTLGFWGVTGNRLYRNSGRGMFEDATDAAGVRVGFWGWGSSFADFNNDGLLDLFHVNGWPGPSAPEFYEDPSRMFIAKRPAFVESSEPLGLADTDQGRGVVCFDYDGDGDLDIFVANNAQAPRLYRNDGGNSRSYLNVKLAGNAPNTEGVGARILIASGGGRQMREIHIGCNFASNNPTGAHFGLEDLPAVDTLGVLWPNGRMSVFLGVPSRQSITVSPGDGDVEVTVDSIEARVVEWGEIQVRWVVSGGDFLALERETENGTVRLLARVEERGVFRDRITGDEEIRYHLVGWAAGRVLGQVVVPRSPPAVRLSLGRPNPFGPRVRFDANIPRSFENAPAEIAVYDALGRRIRVVHKGPIPSGTTSFDWDGRNDRGAEMASGLYFVRLTVGGAAHTTKVTLTR